MIKASIKKRQLRDPLDPSEQSAEALLVAEPGIAAILAGRADGPLLKEVARRLLVFAGYLQGTDSRHLARRLTARATELLEAAAKKAPPC
jgi:hypothetical protein